MIVVVLVDRKLVVPAQGDRGPLGFSGQVLPGKVVEVPYQVRSLKGVVGDSIEIAMTVHA